MAGLTLFAFAERRTTWLDQGFIALHYQSQWAFSTQSFSNRQPGLNSHPQRNLNLPAHTSLYMMLRTPLDGSIHGPKRGLIHMQSGG